MPPHKDFGAYEPDDDDEGPTFTLAGELFHCLPEMPGGAFVNIASVNPDDMSRFIRRCLVPEDRRRFDDLLVRDLDYTPSPGEVDRGEVRRAPIVEPDRLVAVVRWLVASDGGAISPFVEARQSRSQPGPRSTGTTSGPESEQPDKTPAG